MATAPPHEEDAAADVRKPKSEVDAKVQEALRRTMTGLLLRTQQSR